jgi:hypothetical protein
MVSLLDVRGAIGLTAPAVVTLIVVAANEFSAENEVPAFAPVAPHA